MAEMTKDQAIALARARLRAMEQQQTGIEGQLQTFPWSEREKQQEINRYKYSPTTGMSDPELLAAGVGKGITDIGRGAGQWLGAVSREDVAAARARDKPLMQTPAGAGGDILGTASLLAPTAFIPGVNTYTGAALTGAGIGALAPSTSTGETLSNIGAGALAAPVVLGAMRGIGGIVGALRAGAEPMTEAGQGKIIGRLLNKSAGSDAQQVISNLSNAQPLVPGSMPTAGQVAQSGGIAALERAAAQAAPEDYANRAIAQNAARLDAVRRIAGTEAERGQFEGIRSMMADPLYAEARQLGIDPAAAKANAPLIKNLMERMPNGVVDRARELARIKGEPMTETGSVSGLHWVKKAIDDMIDAAPSSGMGKLSKSALLDYKGDLMTTLEKLSPKYAEANRAFSQWSRPINEMDVGSALLNKLEPALTQGNVPIRMNAESFARSLRDSDALARQATGFKGATLEGVLKPEQIASLNAVKDDLARSAVAANLGRGAGSNTFQNLAQENLMQSAGVSSMPQLLSRPVQMTNYILRSIYGSANDEMKRKISQALLDPQIAAGLMRDALPTARQRALEEVMRRAGAYIPAVGATPIPVAAGSRETEQPPGLAQLLNRP